MLPLLAELLLGAVMVTVLDVVVLGEVVEPLMRQPLGTVQV